MLTVAGPRKMAFSVFAYAVAIKREIGVRWINMVNIIISIKCR